MLQEANIDLFNPSVPKGHNSKSQNLLFNSILYLLLPLQIKPASTLRLVG